MSEYTKKARKKYISAGSLPFTVHTTSFRCAIHQTNKQTNKAIEMYSANTGWEQCTVWVLSKYTSDVTNKEPLEAKKPHLLMFVLAKPYPLSVTTVDAVA